MGTTITIDAPGGPAEAYLSGAPGGPGVLLYVDAIGLRPQIQQMADRVAGWGCLVLAPHIFYRHGSASDLAPAGGLRTDADREAFFAGGVRERMAALTPALAAADAEAWISTLSRHQGRQAGGHQTIGPIGTVGYCMGARLALRTGGQFPGRVVAVGGFHGGGLVTDDADSPHLSIGPATASYAFGHADEDPSMPSAAVEALGETLAASGRPHSNEVYAGARHGYSMADTSMYDEAAAERHFADLHGLFAATLATS